ncbi:cation:proton antiporter [Chiayiivirga flava]|uniref:NhaP-type Na+/H+ or K+/H+ antiporter n=1 Tax=Chiayiivirga flava TaxID=659595 RepID=A0A7W8D3N0_9GAMM|nr:cation:proton antiporter [Chiayiivirga flava]MBB5206877.1 NhaP-type Na+/H+ or K+/H+ antiporter [Chiayiivirga flava]
MGFLGWMAVIGTLLLLMALGSAYLRRLPLTAAAIYLGVGLLLGPGMLGLVRIDLADSAPLLEHLTELAVILSLFIGGLKLRLPLRHAAWRSAYLLAGPVMVVCIAGVAAVAYFVLGFDLPAALLLGALLAPTDPVLAGLVSVNDAEDHDRLRYGLSGEAGLNDGTAFPFVALALLLTQAPVDAGTLGGWALHRLVYAVPAGLLLGFVMGRILGQSAIALRSAQRDVDGPNDVLALALIVLSYVAAEANGAWGFLAVFAAGVGFREAEIRVVTERPHPDAAQRPRAADGGRQADDDVDTSTPAHPPAENLVETAPARGDMQAQPSIAAGLVVADMLSFGATAERLLEVLLVVIVGCALATHWDPMALLIGAALFGVIRPLAVAAILRAAPVTATQRRLMAWFGIRGIGSVYYLCYALTHGFDGPHADRVVDITLSVVALSIVAHGVTVRAALTRYERGLRRAHPTD